MLLPLISLALTAVRPIVAADPFDPGPDPKLMRHPALSATTIVFQFAGDLWSVPREGGDATRLTASVGNSNANPVFSPDGTQIAFTGNYDGNQDVYMMPATGGIPKRLTAHPAVDNALGWTPDGRSVLISSMMVSEMDYPRLFTVSTEGGVPKALPFPAGVDGCFSPDGSQIAYVPNPKWEDAWKRYRGGQMTPIWIGNIADSKVHSIPRHNTNDFNPVWSGDSIYYLSDPTGPVGLNRYDVKSGKARTIIPGNGFDLKSFSVYKGTIAYEKLGSIHLYDTATGQDHAVPVKITGDFPDYRTQFKNLRSQVTSVSVSPTGKRAVISARGWVFTVPSEKGDTRLLDDRQGCDRTNARWSPDGKTIAYVCDDGSGEHISLYDLATSKERSVALGDAPADCYTLVWSPDSAKIAYTDNKLRFWILDVATGKSTLVDEDYYRAFSLRAPSWSPDSKWLTWSRTLKNFVNTVFVYNLATGKKSQVTDGLADATLPVFDRSGKYLYFVASTNIGFGMDNEDLESLAVTNTYSNVYAAILGKSLPNPLSPESDEEKPKEKKDEKEEEAPKVDIDLDGIQRRIVTLPFEKAAYQALAVGPSGIVFAMSQPPRATPVDDSEPGPIARFSFSDRKVTPFLPSSEEMQVSDDGTKMLVGQRGAYRIVGTETPAGPRGGELDLSNLMAKVDPVVEWRSIYHEVWRQERTLFYDPHLHGIDADVMEKRYEPFLDGIRSRQDLNYLFTDMLGELCIGHMFISGGDRPPTRRQTGGLLGADYSFDKGRYKLTRVYDGESWNPELKSPLGAPGVNAKAGEYLLAIDGKELTEATDIYTTLEGKAGRQVSVKLGPTSDGVGSREVVVVPVASEAPLRERAWEEDNRRYVDKETGGKGGYVHVPDTATDGWAAFMRYYYSQVDKDGMIVDDRFNHGGYINDFMVREMEKPLDFFGATRYGNMFKVPNAAIYGPKVMLINEMAGSGGDLFPYLFRSHRVGKLIGMRTWGGELTAAGFRVIDGGFVRAPEDAEFDPKTGKYVIDNVGVPPDIEVPFDPVAWRSGVDAQLKAAVEELKKQMEAHPPLKIKRPAYPDKSTLEKIGKN